MREFRPPAGSQLPVLALDVVNNRRAGPGQKRRNHEAHALARASRRKSHDVLRPVMAQIAIFQLAEKDPCRPKKPYLFDLPPRGPARGAVCRDQTALPCPPKRAGNGGGASHEATGCSHRTGLVENLRCISLELEPPRE